MKTERKSAIVAGFALVIMAITAGITYGYLHNKLVVESSPEVIFSNLQYNRSLFNAEIFGWVFILILDVIVAWALYVFFRNENKRLSLLTAELRIVFVIIFAVAVFNLTAVLQFLNGNVGNDQMAGQQIMNSVESFESIWSFALIVFGFHLLFLGVLALQSKNIHNAWGILLIFAAVSYVVIHSAKFLFLEFESQIATAEMILSLPMAFGEIGFAFWLIIRGGSPRIVFRQTKSVVTN